MPITQKEATLLIGATIVSVEKPAKNSNFYEVLLQTDLGAASLCLPVHTAMTMLRQPIRFIIEDVVDIPINGFADNPRQSWGIGSRYLKSVMIHTTKIQWLLAALRAEFGGATQGPDNLYSFSLPDGQKGTLIHRPDIEPHAWELIHLPCVEVSADGTEEF